MLLERHGQMLYCRYRQQEKRGPGMWSPTNRITEIEPAFLHICRMNYINKVHSSRKHFSLARPPDTKLEDLLRKKFEAPSNTFLEFQKMNVPYHFLEAKNELAPLLQHWFLISGFPDANACNTIFCLNFPRRWRKRHLHQIDFFCLQLGVRFPFFKFP